MGNSVNEKTLVAARQFCGGGGPVAVSGSFLPFRRLGTGYGLWFLSGKSQKGGRDARVCGWSRLASSSGGGRCSAGLEKLKVVVKLGGIGTLFRWMRLFHSGSNRKSAVEVDVISNGRGICGQEKRQLLL